MAIFSTCSPFPSLLAVPLACLALASPAGAQDKQAPLALELNAASTEGEACKLTFVATNRSATALARADYELAIFDAQGIISSLTVLQFGPLAGGKTRVLQFNLPGLPCEEMTRIVVNGAPSCLDAAGGASDTCMSGLETSSRSAIQFGL